MAPLVEGSRTADFIISEANSYRSRDAGIVTVPANSTIEAGTILGAITASGKYVTQLVASSDGSEDEAALLYEPLVNTTDSPVDFAATLIVRDAEVTGSQLTYDPAANAAAITASNVALAALGLIVR